MLLGVSATQGLDTIKSNSFYGYQYTCTFELGGGNTYFKIGNYKQEECLDQCMAKKKHDNAINGIGVYTDQSKGGCWCLKNMPNRNHYHMFKSCAIKEDASETVTLAGNAYQGAGVTCSFKPGGGNTFKWAGNYKQSECLSVCLKKKGSDSSVNGIGVYADQNKGGCWCLKNMPNRNHYRMFKSCVMETGKGAEESSAISNGHRYTCEFRLGGGNTFFKIGNYKQDQCLQECLKRKVNDNAINGIGVYTDQTRGGCWCLKNMPNRNNEHVFKSCVISDRGVVAGAQTTAAPTTTTRAPTQPPTTAGNAFSKGSICERKFKKIGCYNRDWGKVPHLLITDLDATHKNYTKEMDWGDYNKGLHSIACRCLKIAVGHYKYFAIGFNGECVAGKDHEELEEMFRIKKEDKSGCINGNWEACDKNHHAECTGNADYDFFYQVL